MTKKEYLESAGKCELCDCSKTLEIHHIVPLCAGGEDCLDNWIAICSSCHSKLTPTSQLTKLGLKRSSIQNNIIDIYNSFYERANAMVETANIDCIDIFDLFDSVYNEFGVNALNQLHVNKRN